MDDKTLIPVRNRNNGHTGYTLKDGNKEDRTWTPGEVKKITFDELRRVSYTDGGAELLRNYLVVENKEAAEALEIGIDVDTIPEYLYTEEDVKKILLEGSLDELRDFLDFSPEGGIDILKDLAIKLEVPDTRKRKIISEATGLNINTAIEINHLIDGEEEKQEEETKVRRVKKAATEAESAPTGPVRRVTKTVSTK